MSEENAYAKKAAALGIEHFAAGFNCAEAVLLGVTEALGQSGDALPMIATGFGAGIARHGETCGAVTGAVMAIGLFQGRRRAEDLEARERTYASVDAMVKGFCEAHGTLNCRQLTGCDLQTEEGRKKAAETRTHQDLCPKFVALAAELAVRQIHHGGTEITE